MEPTIIQKIAIWALPLIFAITLHEVAHGWVASWFGDQTARLSGRLSLNPLKHIDPIGTIVVPFLMLMTTNFIFGWAKPVPVDPRNFHNPRRDMAIVALAGPVSNFLMAIVWGILLKIALGLGANGYDWIGTPLAYMGEAGVGINVVLGVLNLLPLPPLDGGNILMGILPKQWAYRVSLIEPYGFIILILLLVTNMLGRIIGPMVHLVMWTIYRLLAL